ncbi:MAG: glycosyltransferase [Frankiaceae bacterium]|nr:glycosyltransferase [Arenimonas sp.]
MRRLTVLQLLPALGSGGVEKSTLEIGAALVQAGHRSIVISAGGRMLDALQRAGSEHITLDIGRKSLSTLRHAWTLRRLIRQLQPDIVHARSRLPAWLAWLAMRGIGGGRPHFVTTVHGLNSPGWYSSIMTRGDRVICVSGSVRAHVLSNWPDTKAAKLTVIERGVDTDLFCPAPGPLTLIDATRRLLMPGRGTRLKGHEAALTLLADLRRAGCDARLWLLGTHEPGREAYVAELEALADTLGVADALEISPPRHDVIAAYRQSDLVLQLSAKPEAFGRTVVEALASGVPVVGWAHGGVGELLARYFPDGQVAPGDRQALLATTLSVLGKAPVLPPLQAQSLAQMQAQTLKVYESLLD